MEMKAAEVEISDAVRQVQGGPAIIRHMCIICKDYLTDWDVFNGYGLCWSCRSVYFPAPGVEEKMVGLRRAILVPLKYGRCVILLSQ
jgi:hypothetical protein